MLLKARECIGFIRLLSEAPYKGLDFIITSEDALIDQ